MWIGVLLCMILYKMQAAGSRCKLVKLSYHGVLGATFTTTCTRSRLRGSRIHSPHPPAVRERRSGHHLLRSRAAHGVLLGIPWSAAGPLTIRWGILERGP